MPTRASRDKLTQQLKEVTEERLSSSDVWWALRANFNGEEAESCRQAATVRDRLGSGEYGGIPLWCELKSEVGKITNVETGETKFYAAHTRGNTRFDAARLCAVFGWNVAACDVSTMISDVEDGVAERATKRDAVFFGLVNPFNVDVLCQSQGQDVSAREIYQIFDVSLRLRAGCPNTIMTNAGSRTKAFEIRPKDLIFATAKEFPNTCIKEITGPDPIWLGVEGRHKKNEWLRFPPPAGPKIGILTGNSPESGLTLWQDILGIFRRIYTRRATDVFMPDVVVHSLPGMGISMELVKREKFVWDAMERAIGELLRSGCKLITVACNTSIYFEPRVNAQCQSCGAQFVSIAEACIPSILRGLRDTESSRQAVGLVGIGPVIDVNGGYSGYARHLRNNNIEVVPCAGEELAYLMKNVGGMQKDTAQRAITKFRRLMNDRLPDVEVVVLALTEVSLAYRLHIENAPKGRKASKLFVDPLYELAAHLVFRYLREGLATMKVCQLPESFAFEQQLEDRVSAASREYRARTPEDVPAESD